MTSQIALRLASEQLAAIDALVPDHHRSRSEVIRRAVDLYLYGLACERDADLYSALPLTTGELAMADDPAAWEATPAW